MSSADGLTIGELAAYVGVSQRTIRHYHARGLLSEPARDASGYRRYTAQDAVDLIRVRTLAEAGVPLSRAGELLHAGAAKFDAAIAEIDRALRAEIRRLQRQRERVAQLASGEALTLPQEVLAYLDRLRELGVSERLVGAERDGWIVVTAREGDKVRDWAVGKEAALDDPDFIEIYRGLDQAYDWGPDDPRLVELADALELYTEKAAAEAGTELEEPVDGTTNSLLNTFPVPSPGWLRLIELFVERRIGRWG